jgi:hypothetical protein
MQANHVHRATYCARRTIQADGLNKVTEDRSTTEHACMAVDADFGLNIDRNEYAEIRTASETNSRLDAIELETSRSLSKFVQESACYILSAIISVQLMGPSADFTTYSCTLVAYKGNSRHHA